jgi:hypothetical protein
MCSGASSAHSASHIVPQVNFTRSVLIRICVAVLGALGVRHRRQYVPARRSCRSLHGRSRRRPSASTEDAFAHDEDEIALAEDLVDLLDLEHEARLAFSFGLLRLALPVLPSSSLIFLGRASGFKISSCPRLSAFHDRRSVNSGLNWFFILLIWGARGLRAVAVRRLFREGCYPPPLPHRVETEPPRAAPDAPAPIVTRPVTRPPRYPAK